MRAQKIILIFAITLFYTNIVAQTGNLIEKGYQKLEARELNEAINFFSQALQQQPADTAALTGIIRAHLLADNLRDAQRFIENALKEHPNNPEFHFRQGILNNKRGQYRKAIIDFNNAYEHSSDSRRFHIYINRGIAYMNDNDYENAYQDFFDALEINPRHSTTLSFKAFTSYRLGNFIESIEDYNKAIDLNPENAMHYYNRGMAHLRSGNKSNACSDFHQACSRGNKNACRMIMTECGGMRQQ